MPSTDGFASDWVKLWKRKGKAYGESIGIDDLVMVSCHSGWHHAGGPHAGLHDHCSSCRSLLGGFVFDIFHLGEMIPN